MGKKKITDEMRIKFRNGHYICSIPPTTHHNWSEDDWIRWILKTGKFK